MKINTIAVFKNPMNILQVSCCIVLLYLINGCASIPDPDTEKDVRSKTHLFVGDSNKQKSIFVLLDGTANDQKSETNVWRLYQTLLKNNDPQMTAMYIEGVGSVDRPILGMSLGRGMEERILKGYEFIAKNYNPNDDIYIFGFSRGAHQARSLAGLLSYAGVPANSNETNDNVTENSNKIIELVKKKSDDDYLKEWGSWNRGKAPILASDIHDQLNLEMLTTEIKFLGVWDTVPGSVLKNYGYCKEEKGFVKKNLFWLIPGVDKGERYKSDSYPPIRKIAHAVSLDEKRSMFTPILLCPPINLDYTNINEEWFPGAHADVGGGYDDSNELPTLSLAWMISLLKGEYTFNTPPQFQGNAIGLAHWSIGDSPANTGSECVDRHPSDSAKVNPSFDERRKSSPVPIIWKGTKELKNYPIDCSRK